MTLDAQGHSGRPRAEYEADAAAYLQRVAALFGAYKRRSFDFMQLGPGLRVLDAGCGTGDDAVALAALVQPGGAATGLDASAELVEAARRKAAPSGLPVEFIAGDIGHMPFPDGAFDRVRADRVFQHLADPGAAVGELLRVTAPGGWVVLLDVDWATLVVSASDARLTRRILGFLVERQVAPHAGRALPGLLRRAGLASVELYPEVAVLERLAAANRVWGLDVYAHRAAEAGAIEAAEAETWLADLAQQEREGAFLASMTGFVARGRKLA
jgi:SAM-dependent methyltransferase